MWLRVLLVVFAINIASGALYDAYTGKQLTAWRSSELRRIGVLDLCGIEIPPCMKEERRRVDGTCNSLKYPQRGAAMTPFARLLPPIFGPNYGLSRSSSGAPLPGARKLRVALMSDGRVPNKEFTHLVTYFTVFLAAEVTSAHDTTNYVLVTRTCCTPAGRDNPRCIPIAVPEDDPHLRYSSVRCMNLTRAITYQDIRCAPEGITPERVTVAPSMLELSVLYGASEELLLAARTQEGGQLISETIDGKEWPPNGSIFCTQNLRPTETRCHGGSGNPTSNGPLGVNLHHMWFFRNHNYVARRLQAMNPCWDDDRLFREARDINIAYANHILYYELMPSIMGYDYLAKQSIIYNTKGHVDDYDETLEPRTFIEFAVGSRWFHNMQEGRVKLYDKKGTYLREISVVDMTTRSGALVFNKTFEGITLGSFRQPAGGHDYVVDPDMGERVLGRLNRASDVVSADMMKGRDVGLPPYNHYRKLCGLPPAKSFEELHKWMPVDQVDALASNYETVDDIEMMTGIMGEKAMPGAVMGPTLACIIAKQLERWRRADRHWYERPNRPWAFTAEQLAEVKKISLARILCDHGDGVDKIQPYPFLLPGYDNKMVPCSQIPEPNLEAWKDPKCYVKDRKYQYQTPVDPYSQNLNNYFVNMYN